MSEDTRLMALAAAAAIASAHTSARATTNHAQYGAAYSETEQPWPTISFGQDDEIIDILPDGADSVEVSFYNTEGKVLRRRSQESPDTAQIIRLLTWLIKVAR